MSHTNAGLQRIMDALNDAGKVYGMKINRRKTKLMRISKQPWKVVKLFIDGYQIEQVSSFCYLGSMITEDGRPEKEIKCSWNGKIKILWQSQDLHWAVEHYHKEAND